MYISILVCVCVVYIQYGCCTQTIIALAIDFIADTLVYLLSPYDCHKLILILTGYVDDWFHGSLITQLQENLQQLGGQIIRWWIRSCTVCVNRKNLFYFCLVFTITNIFPLASSGFAMLAYQLVLHNQALVSFITNFCFWFLFLDLEVASYSCPRGILSIGCSGFFNLFVLKLHSLIIYDLCFYSKATVQVQMNMDETPKILLFFAMMYGHGLGEYCNT